MDAQIHHEPELTSPPSSANDAGKTESSDAGLQWYMWLIIAAVLIIFIAGVIEGFSIYYLQKMFVFSCSFLVAYLLVTSTFIECGSLNKASSLKNESTSMPTSSLDFTSFNSIFYNAFLSNESLSISGKLANDDPLKPATINVGSNVKIVGRGHFKLKSTGRRLGIKADLQHFCKGSVLICYNASRRHPDAQRLCSNNFCGFKLSRDDTHIHGIGFTKLPSDILRSSLLVISTFIECGPLIKASSLKNGSTSMPRSSLDFASFNDSSSLLSSTLSNKSLPTSGELTNDDPLKPVAIESGNNVLINAPGKIELQLGIITSARPDNPIHEPSPMSTPSETPSESPPSGMLTPANSLASSGDGNNGDDGAGGNDGGGGNNGGNGDGDDNEDEEDDDDDDSKKSDEDDDDEKEEEDDDEDETKKKDDEKKDDDDEPPPSTSGNCGSNQDHKRKADGKDDDPPPPKKKHTSTSGELSKDGAPKPAHPSSAHDAGKTESSNAGLQWDVWFVIVAVIVLVFALVFGGILICWGQKIVCFKVRPPKKIRKMDTDSMNSIIVACPQTIKSKEITKDTTVASIIEKTTADEVAKPPVPPPKPAKKPARPPKKITPQEVQSAIKSIILSNFVSDAFVNINELIGEAHKLLEKHNVLIDDGLITVHINPNGDLQDVSTPEYVCLTAFGGQNRRRISLDTKLKDQYSMSLLMVIAFTPFIDEGYRRYAPAVRKRNAPTIIQGTLPKERKKYGFPCNALDAAYKKDPFCFENTDKIGTFSSPNVSEANSGGTKKKARKFLLDLK